jgi:hypothetical protein
MLLVGAPLCGEPSTRETCAANLRLISAAAHQWAIVYQISSTNTVPLKDTNFWQFLKGGTLPVCPGAGTYDASKALMDEPICSVHGTIDRSGSP